jgi:predicted kinase
MLREVLGARHSLAVVGSMRGTDEPAALLITGTVGSGKTTTAEALGDRLGELNTPHAVIDLDWLSRSWPAPAGDRFNTTIELRNLQAVAGNFFRAGATRLVLAGVVESEEMRARYEHVLGVPMVVCRLQVDLERVRVRLVQRHRPGREREWHLHRSGELDRILRSEAIGDHVITVAEHTPEEVADAVASVIGW